MSFIYALSGSFAYDDRPVWMPWTWLFRWHTIWVLLVLVGIVWLARVWKVSFLASIIATMYGIVVALPFFWLMPRRYVPLQPTYYGVAIVYDETYPSVKENQARDLEAGLYTKDCLIRQRRSWANQPTKLPDMKLVPFLTWQVGVAYGFNLRTCTNEYVMPRTFLERVSRR